MNSAPLNVQVSLSHYKQFSQKTINQEQVASKKYTHKRLSKFKRRDFYQANQIQPNFLAEEDSQDNWEQLTVNNHSNKLSKTPFQSLSEQLQTKINKQQDKISQKISQKRRKYYKRNQQNTKLSEENKIYQKDIKEINTNSESNSIIFDMNDGQELVFIQDQIQKQLSNDSNFLFTEQNKSDQSQKIIHDSPRFKQHQKNNFKAPQQQLFRPRYFRRKPMFKNSHSESKQPSQTSESSQDFYKRSTSIKHNRRYITNTSKKQQSQQNRASIDSNIRQRSEPQLISNKESIMLNNANKNQNKFQKMRLVRVKQWSGDRYQLSRQNDHSFVLSAQVLSPLTCYIYGKKGNYDSKDPYLAVLQSNFPGSIINIYVPHSVNSQGQQRKCLIGTIKTKTQNFMDSMKPRQFFVYFYKELENSPILSQNKKQIPLNQLYYKSNRAKQNIICFYNKQPKWCKKQMVHVIDMHGRAKEASVKNFILCNQEQQQCMIFGKQDQKIFNLDFAKPLNSVLALAISLSSFLYRSW